MKALIALALALAIATPAVAFDLGAHAPVKTAVLHTPPPANPDVIRQGGDTILDAVELYLPVWDLPGTTVGYTDDYDEVCPYSQSTSPDVVYSFMVSWETAVDIDMFGSTYDTKIYLYDENLNLIACNDDYYSDYVSRLENVPVQSGVLYYLVIDGYGGDAGEYVLSLYSFGGHGIYCPEGFQEENEPPLAVNYVDLYNGGCNTPEDPEFPHLQHIDQMYFCGVSGFYVSEAGNSRDTDWFTVTVPSSGTLAFWADADVESYVFELGPQDCDQVAVIQNIVVGPFWQQEMIIEGEPGTDVWIWVGPTTFTSPDGSDVYEYDYVLEFPDVVGVEDLSWSAVKALFH